MRVALRASSAATAAAPRVAVGGASAAAAAAAAARWSSSAAAPAASAVWGRGAAAAARGSTAQASTAVVTAATTVRSRASAAAASAAARRVAASQALASRRGAAAWWKKDGRTSGPVVSNSAAASAASSSSAKKSASSAANTAATGGGGWSGASVTGAATKAGPVFANSPAGNAPFPLRLVYTFRSSPVVLRSSGKPGRPLFPMLALVGLNCYVWWMWRKVPEGQDLDVFTKADHPQSVLEWKPADTKVMDEHQDFMLRHFTASVRNLREGRLHTLFTSGFSHEGLAHLTGNMVALTLFGWRAYAALGGPAFMGLYLFGAFAASSAHIMHNIFYGRTQPVLSSAELRAELQTVFRELETEHQSKSIVADGGQSLWARLAGGSGDQDSRKQREEQEQQQQQQPIAPVAAPLPGAKQLDDDPAATAPSSPGSAPVPPPTPSEEPGASDYFTAIGEWMAEAGQQVINMLAEEGEAEVDDETAALVASSRHGGKIDMESLRLEKSLKTATEIIQMRFVNPRDIPSLGASGSVMAIANGSALLFPRDLFVSYGVNIPLPITVGLYTASDLYGVVYPDPKDMTDHAGHLLGAGAGLLYVWFRWAVLRANPKSGVKGSLPIFATLWTILRRGRR